MKRAVDKSLGVFLGIIAIMAGFSIAAELLRPYMGWIVGAATAVIVAVALVLLSPLIGRIFARIRGTSSEWSE